MYDLITTEQPLGAAASAPLTATGFRAWLHRAAAGERLIYWHGVLARDRAPGSSLDKRHRVRLDKLAALALAAAEAGLVHLVQQRLGAGVFAYLAIRSRKPIPRPEAAAQPTSTDKEPSMQQEPPTCALAEAA